MSNEGSTESHESAQHAADDDLARRAVENRSERQGASVAQEIDCAHHDLDRSAGQATAAFNEAASESAERDDSVQGQQGALSDGTGHDDGDQDRAICDRALKNKADRQRGHSQGHGLTPE